jgi:hypothetical protein
VLDSVSAVSASDVWAVGYAPTVQDTQQPLTLHWNGSNWQQVPAVQVGKFDTLAAVAALSATDVWAVGDTATRSGTATPLIENGTRWQVMPSPSPGSYASLGGVAAVAADEVWAVGASSGTGGTLTELWNGRQWRVVPSANVTAHDGFQAVTVVPGSRQLWAVGSVMTGPGTTVPLIEQWTGTAWQIVPSPQASSSILYGVAALSAGAAWAVGQLFPSGQLPSQPLLERWDGARWQIVVGPIPGTLYNTLQGVTGIPETRGLWAVGAYANRGANSPTKTLTELYLLGQGKGKSRLPGEV